MCAQKQWWERNWRCYNEALARRGEFYLSVDAKANYDHELREMNCGKCDRPFKFSDSMITPIALFHTILHLPYRQPEGFLRSL